jgi:hypothetical protein
MYFMPIPSLMYLLLRICVTWRWVAWLRSAGNFTHDWRGYAALAGLCLATFSTALSIFLATITGGYPF